jgi:hypothetical protein
MIREREGAAPIYESPDRNLRDLFRRHLFTG